jgi:anti-sigma factor RsiW
MSGNPGGVTHDDLHAYVDGALDPENRARVEAHLAANAEDGERVRAYQRQNDALRALGTSLDRAPTRLPFKVQRRRPIGVRALRALPWAAAVAGLLVLGGAGGWWARNKLDTETPELSQLSAVAYQLYSKQTKHPVEVWANERDHLQKWLTICLNAPLVAPEFANDGYTLVGGRLLSNTQGAAALLLYEGKDKQHVALYIANTAQWGHGPAMFEEVGKVGTFTWIQGPLWYSLAGNLDAAELKRMARIVNQQVTAAQETAPIAVAQRR